MDLKAAWDKFSVGDSISDEELDGMIKQTEAALPYLIARSEYTLARRDAAITLNRLQSYQQARKADRKTTLPELKAQAPARP